jgi:epoxyqueuosine reductase
LLSHSEKELDLILKKQFEHYGIAPLSRPVSMDVYEEWIASGKHASMEFLKEHLPKKQKPQSIEKSLRTCIAVSVDYVPHPKAMDLGFKALDKIKIGAYALGEDYHHWLKEKLELCIEELKKKWPEESFMAFTDSGPVLERDLAYQAGLGWVGKNTCLIHPKQGSMFFIGEILTSLNLESSHDLVPDRCGTCTRCIDACPTDALKERDLDARKCISYLSIEHKGQVEEKLAEAFGPWFYGCDICQAVCPWNEKKYGKDFLGDKSFLKGENLSQELAPEERSLLIEDIRQILSSSNKAITRRFRGSPMTRANPNMHKRNALFLVKNYQLKELVPEIRSIAEKDSSADYLRSTATWVLQSFNDQ